MIGAAFSQLLIKKSSSFIGKFDTNLQLQLDKLQLAKNERDTNKSAKICFEVSKNIGTFKNPVNDINKILIQLKNIILSIQTTLVLLKNLNRLINRIPIKPISAPAPIPAVPSVVPPLPTLYPSIGNLMKIVDIKSKADKQIEMLNSFLSGLTSLIGILSQMLKSLSDKMKTLSDEVNSCQIKHSINEEDRKQIQETLSQLLIDITKEIPDNLIYEDNSYKGYTFEIVELTDKFTNEKINQRYAVAYNSNGIETLRGSISFATNKQILINELKFKIDNEQI